MKKVLSSQIKKYNLFVNNDQKNFTQIYPKIKRKLDKLNIQSFPSLVDDKHLVVLFQNSLQFELLTI